MRTFKGLALCQAGILVLSEDPWLVPPNYTFKKSSINLAAATPSYALIDIHMTQEVSVTYVEE